MVCAECDEESGAYDNYTHTEAETVLALKMAYGREALRVQDETTHGDRDATGFGDFLVYAYPDHMLDALEAFYRLLSDGKKHPFQMRANAVLTEEDSPWRLCDGRMYMVDSRFLDDLKNQIEEEMKRENLLGAHEEFRDARSYLQTGDRPRHPAHPGGAWGRTDQPDRRLHVLWP